MNNSIPQDEPQYNPSHAKRCPRCDSWLPFSSFYRNKRNSDGLNGWCGKCCSKYQKENRPPEDNREQKLRINYGITTKQYNKMLEDQGGVCASCKTKETRIDPRTGRVRFLDVDHDHKTGDVRALLCNECNTAFGSLKEDPERIQWLKEYAEWCQIREPNVRIIQLPLIGE